MVTPIAGKNLWACPLVDQALASIDTAGWAGGGELEYTASSGTQDGVNLGTAV